MEQFLKFLISPLLSEPDQLSITQAGGSIVLKVSQADMGRIIGKHGTIIGSIRTLCKTYSYLHQIPPENITLAETAQG